MVWMWKRRKAVRRKAVKKRSYTRRLATSKSQLETDPSSQVPLYRQTRRPIPIRKCLRASTAKMTTRAKTAACGRAMARRGTHPGVVQPLSVRTGRCQMKIWMSCSEKRCGASCARPTKASRVRGASTARSEVGVARQGSSPRGTSPSNTGALVSRHGRRRRIHTDTSEIKCGRLREKGKQQRATQNQRKRHSRLHWHRYWQFRTSSGWETRSKLKHRIRHRHQKD